MAADFAATPVELHVGDMTYTTTAGEIGLMVDEDETAATAMEVGEDAFLLARPVRVGQVALHDTRRAAASSR